MTPSPAPAPAPAPSQAGSGCDSSCSRSHSSDGPCLVCGDNWGPHSGHNCNKDGFRGRRGSWAVGGAAAAAASARPPTATSTRHSHSLAATDDGRRRRARCDVCRSSGDCVYFCRSCDWDICGRCFASETASAAGAAAGAAAPIPAGQQAHTGVRAYLRINVLNLSSVSDVSGISFSLQRLMAVSMGFHVGCAMIRGRC